MPARVAEGRGSRPVRVLLSASPISQCEAIEAGHC